MAIRWVDDKFSTTRGFLGDIEIGTIHWISARGTVGVAGYQFRSEFFGTAPDVLVDGEIWPSPEDAKKEAELKALAFAEYIFKTVHGEQAWTEFTEARSGS